MTPRTRPNPADAGAPKTRRLRIGIDPRLQSLFAQFNRDYFGGAFRADEHIVAWTRTRTAKATTPLGRYWGRCQRTNRYLTTIDYDLRSDPEALRATLVHEMVHAKLDGNRRIRDDHGWRFRSEMRRLEKLGACQIPVLCFEYLDEKTGKVEKRTCKEW